MEGQTALACPLAYPSPYKRLYEEFTDTRGCTECGCGSVSGGSCSGNTVLSSSGDCSTSGNPPEFTPGKPCKSFNMGSGSVHPERAGYNYTLVAGTCSVVTPPQPTGGAVVSGLVTVVCCQAAE